MPTPRHRCHRCRRWRPSAWPAPTATARSVSAVVRRRPQAAALSAGGSEPAASAALRLTGVLLTGDFGMAVYHRTEPLAAPAPQRRSRGWLAAGGAAAAPGDGDRPRWQPGPGTGGVHGQGGEPPTVLRGANGAPPAGAIVVPPSAGAPAPPPPAAIPSPSPAGNAPAPAAPLQQPHRPTTTVPVKRRCRPSASASRPAAASCSNSSNNRRRPGRWHQPIE